MKKRSSLLMIAMLLIGSIAVAQKPAKTIHASNKYVTKQVKVPEFTGIQVTGSTDVVYTQNKREKTSVEIYGSDNLVALVDIEVKNGVLEVKWKTDKPNSINFGKDGRLKVNVSSPILEKASVKGSGDILLKNTIDAQHLTLHVNGSGDIKAAGNIVVNRLHANIEGSGDIKVKGKIQVENVHLSLKGSGDIEANNIEAVEATIDLNGSGDIDIKGALLTNNTHITLKGSGDVKAKNINSKNVHASLEGSGDMELRGETDTATLSLRSSGKIQAEKLIAREVSASLNGSGNIKCYADKKLVTNITGGSGTIGYKGNPSITNNNSSKQLRKL